MKHSTAYRRLKLLLTKKSFRYLLVGGSVYIFEIFVIIVAQKLGRTATQSVAISFVLGLIVSFLLQKIFTFGDKRMHHKVLFTQVVAVGLLVIFNFSFTVYLTDRLQSILDPTLTRTIALLITTIWNFYLYKTRIFSSQENNKIRTERPSVLTIDLQKRVVTNDMAPVQNESSQEVLGSSDSVEILVQRKRSIFVIILTLLLLLSVMFGSQITAMFQPKQTQNFRQSIRKFTVDATPRPAAISIDGVSSEGCVGKTVLQVIAHPDDDLLFMNPDIMHSLSKGMCVRTLYLTAGDHGWGRSYAMEREQGIRAAYATMLGGSVDWQLHGTMLTGDETVNVDKPSSGNQVEHYYFRLPDGGLDGQGFPLTGNNSLQQLLQDDQKVLVAIDESGRYTRATLLEALSKLIAAYQPVEIRTLSGSDQTGSDHIDHKTVGMLTAQAIEHYRANYDDHDAIRFRRYMGYPIASLKMNITPNEQQTKETAFFAYAKHDRDVCKSTSECTSGDSSYAKYIARKYEVKTTQL